MVRNKYLSLTCNKKVMDTKLTLNFNQEVIQKAKGFAADNNISLSRLTEFLYQKITSGSYASLEDFPISEWVNQVAEGQAEYKLRPSKSAKDEYYSSKR